MFLMGELGFEAADRFAPPCKASLAFEVGGETTALIGTTLRCRVAALRDASDGQSVAYEVALEFANGAAEDQGLQSLLDRLALGKPEHTSENTAAAEQYP